MNDQITPPTEWFEATECPRPGCSETRFTSIGMDLHLLRDHGSGGVRSVPEQVEAV